MNPDQQKEIDDALSDIDFEEQYGNALDHSQQAALDAENAPPDDPYAEKAIDIPFGFTPEGIPLDQDDFTYYFATRIQNAVDSRKDGGFDWLIRDFRNQYDGRLPAKNDPYEGCSNFNVPLSQPIVDTLHANYYTTFFKQTKYFTGVAPTKVASEDVLLKENAIQWIMDEVVDLPKVADELLLRSLIDKGAIAKIEWERTFRKVAKREPDPITGKVKTKQVEEMAFNGAKVSVIDILNYGFYPADAPTRDEIQIEFHRYAASSSDLHKGVLSGRYDRAAVEKITSRPSNWTRNDLETGGLDDKLQEEGITTDSWVSDFDKPYECFQALAYYDCDGKGINSYILLELCMQGDDATGATLLRAQYFPYDHCRSWYVMVSPFIHPGFIYPYSEMERLEDCQAEINAIQNMRTDRAVLENNAPFVADETLKRQIGSTRMAPGTILYSPNPKDALFPIEIATGSQRTPEEVAMIRALAEDIAGINQTVMGKATGDATAREVERSVQGVNIKFDVQLARLSRSLEEIAQQVAELYAQFQPPEFEFAVKEGGLSWDFKTITRSQMATKMGFRVKGTSSLANPEFRAYIGEKLILFGQQSPLVMNDLTRQYAIAQYYLENVAGIEDYERYIGTPEQAAQQQQIAQQQAQQVEEKASISYRADEMFTLGHGLEKGWITPEAYMAAVQLSIAAQMSLPPVPEGVNAPDATDDAAGYEKQSPTGNKLT